MIKLNLGCEDDIHLGEDWINIDIKKRKGVLVHNLNKTPYPFKENSVECVKMGHIIEHLDNPIEALLEIHRICKPGAKIMISAPHFTSLTAYADLTHKRPGISFFTFGSWWTNKSLFDKYRVVEKKLNFTRIKYPWLNYIFNPLINLFPSVYERFFCWILPCSEVRVTLEVVK